MGTHKVKIWIKNINGIVEYFRIIGDQNRIIIIKFQSIETRNSNSAFMSNVL